MEKLEITIYLTVLRVPKQDVTFLLITLIEMVDERIREAGPHVIVFHLGKIDERINGEC